jgi:hypothetical protein
VSHPFSVFFVSTLHTFLDSFKAPLFSLHIPPVLRFIIAYCTMASPAVKKAITEAALQYTKPEGRVFEYGTAGVSRIGEYSTEMNS